MRLSLIFIFFPVLAWAQNMGTVQSFGPGGIIEYKSGNLLPIESGKSWSGNLSIQADYLKAPAQMTIMLSKDCKLVVLDSDDTKLVLGCRKEMK